MKNSIGNYITRNISRTTVILILILQSVFSLPIHTSIKCKFSVDSDIAVSPDLVHKCKDFLALLSVVVSSYASNQLWLFSIWLPKKFQSIYSVPDVEGVRILYLINIVHRIRICNKKIVLDIFICTP